MTIGKGRLLLIASALLLASCSIPLVDDFNPPFAHTWTGSDQSPWFSLPHGTYAVDTKMPNGSCVSSVRLVGQNEYPVVSLWPAFTPHVNGPVPTSNWFGFTAHLVRGTYRFEGKAKPGCEWSVRISGPG
ncbi:MAG TPA: hypothetical protein VHW91_07650 [Candidatus Dormibacteraeota bacterium]|nr:hypothetical protein [Candidatus Dormibacteraeota bacterium]